MVVEKRGVADKFAVVCCRVDCGKQEKTNRNVVKVLYILATFFLGEFKFHSRCCKWNTCFV